MEERYINPHTDFGFTRLFEQAEIAKFSDTDLKAYEESMSAYRDIVNAINTAKKDSFAEGKAEGLQKGMAEGLQKGMEKGVFQTTLNMKKYGAPMDFIIKCTGLSQEEIEALS